jgi:hypothetical protein
MKINKLDHCQKYQPVVLKYYIGSQKKLVGASIGIPTIVI